MRVLFVLSHSLRGKLRLGMILGATLGRNIEPLPAVAQSAGQLSPIR